MTVAALTALGSFSIPNEELSEVFRLWKYGILLLGSCFGILGVMLGCFLLLMLMAEQESYGIPWLYPYVGGNLNERADEKDSMFLAAARKRKQQTDLCKMGKSASGFAENPEIQKLKNVTGILAVKYPDAKYRKCQKGKGLCLAEMEKFQKDRSEES